MHKLYLMVFVAMVSAAVLASSAYAVADPVLEGAKTSITTYFTDNLPVVIGAFIAIALSIWLLGMLFRSVGVGKPKKVN